MSELPTTYSILPGEAEHGYELISIDPSGAVTLVARLTSCAAVHAEAIVDALNLDQHALRLGDLACAQVADDLSGATIVLEQLVEQAELARGVVSGHVLQEARVAIACLDDLRQLAEDNAIPECLRCEARPATIVRDGEALCARCADLIPALGPHPLEVP